MLFALRLQVESMLMICLMSPCAASIKLSMTSCGIFIFSLEQTESVSRLFNHETVKRHSRESN